MTEAGVAVQQLDVSDSDADDTEVARQQERLRDGDRRSLGPTQIVPGAGFC